MPFKLPERYRPAAAIGAGGMGVVQLYRDISLDRDVAVKFTRNLGDIGRVYDELRALQQLRSNHVVQLYDVVRKAPGATEIALVEEYLPGPDLDTLIPLVGHDLLSALWQIAAGLADVHGIGLIHRDIKPNNLKLGADRHIKIIDFGLTRQLGKRAQTVGFVGTDVFAAPELYADGTVNFDQKVDVYAYSVTAWCLTGSNFPKCLRCSPPMYDPAAVDFAKTKAGLPADVASLLQACLATRPTDRPEMTAIRDVLARYLLKDRHRALVVIGGKEHRIDASRRAVRLKVPTGDSVDLQYDGLDFKLSAVTGTVYVNNMPATAGMRLPGRCGCAGLDGSVKSARLCYIRRVSAGDQAMTPIAGRYEIVRRIGEGGMQEVYLAEDQLLGRLVALKRAKNGSAERRFKRSAVLSARVNHPNVAKTLDYVDEAQPFLVEEFIDGCDLSEIVGKRLVNVDPLLATAVAHDIVKGLAASHEQKVLHRDLKPSNIMAVSGLQLLATKITDFGIAKMAEEEFVEAAEGGSSTLTTSKTVVGALPYMAPEAIETPRLVTLAADIWSLGALTYEMVYGRKPFGVGLIAVRNITAGTPPDYRAPSTGAQFRPALSQLQTLIKACLQHDPASRPRAEALASSFSDLCYSRDPRFTGTVTDILYRSYGFIQQDGGPKVFFHLESVYGPKPKEGDRVYFSKYPGGGAERAFPVLKLD